VGAKLDKPKLQRLGRLLPSPQGHYEALGPPKGLLAGGIIYGRQESRRENNWANDHGRVLRAAALSEASAVLAAQPILSRPHETENRRLPFERSPETACRFDPLTHGLASRTGAITQPNRAAARRRSGP
jgi:hypothetical protein